MFDSESAFLMLEKYMNDVKLANKNKDDGEEGEDEGSEDED